MVRAMVELQAGALWSNGADCVSSVGSDESSHRVVGCYARSSESAGVSPMVKAGSTSS